MRKLNWQYTLQWADGEKLNDLFLNLPTAASHWLCCKRQCRIYCLTFFFYGYAFSIIQRVKVICWVSTRPPHCLKQIAYILWTIPDYVTWVVPHDIFSFAAEQLSGCLESHWDKIWQKLELKYVLNYLEKTLQKVNKLLDRWSGPSFPMVYEHMSLKFRKKCSKSASSQRGRVSGLR